MTAPAPDYGAGDNGVPLTFEESAALRLLRQLAARWPATLTLTEVDGTLRVVRTGDIRYEALATIAGILTQGWRRDVRLAGEKEPFNPAARTIIENWDATPGTSLKHLAAGPGLMMLPDGTMHAVLPWDGLVPYERQQGGYWLYGPWCGVHGEGKVFIRVAKAAGQLAIKPVSLADVDYTRYCWGDDLSQLPRTCLAGMPKVPEPAWGAPRMTSYEGLTGMQLGRGYRVPWHPASCQSIVAGGEPCGHAQVWHRHRTRLHPCQADGCTCLDFVRMWPFEAIDPRGTA